MEGDNLSHIEGQWTNEGFNARFDELLQANKDNPDYRYISAYVQVEEEHVNRFGKCRYSSYDSFRHCRRIIIFGKR